MIGNITRDPEYSQGSDGNAYVRFSVACQRRFSNDQGERSADFIDCVAFRQTADFISRYFTKGSKIVVEGRLQSNQYTAQDGSKRYSLNVVVEHAEFGEKAQSGV